MASFPENHYRQFLQLPTPKPQQSKPLRDLYGSNMEGQVSQQLRYCNTPNLLDQHVPYIPPFQVVGLVPGPAHEEHSRLDLQWNSGLDSKKNRPIEQTFLENNVTINKSNNDSQISSLDLLQARSVSTGLGLSLENPRLSASGDSASALLGVVGDALDWELQRQDAEIDRYIKLQGDRLRQDILDKFQATQLQTISYVEEKVLQNLQRKEAKVEDMNKKNMELELRIKKRAMEANAWQQRAKYGENMINTLNLNLQQVYAQSTDDSEVDDTASCCDGRPLDFQVDRNEMRVMY